ncbi:hypothetical protein E2N92_06830 [Methanofollis formosanus]|uniref:Uncharacterized protein n=1 Tax=Methanofollis formosanus TaxID=299308 RepID=A0A8G1A324_9EURY|nr:hypothetical protein [Methanofollis formosanus]QYZ79167.1 hypothetical protein E2N92_06830 [Methanofollis formosanus]
MVDLKLPDLDLSKLNLSDLKVPSLSGNLKKILMALCVVIGLLGLGLVGWTLYHSQEEQHEIGALRDAIASSETDLAGLDREVSALIASVGKYPSLKESDAYMATFRSLAGRGIDITERHRKTIEAIAVPETYERVRTGYLQALDHLNRAYTLWSASAEAYGRGSYRDAEERIDEADSEWQAYDAAIAAYNQEIVLMQQKGEMP